MQNFFSKTLYQKRFIALWWFLGIMAITLLTVSFYDSFKATDVEELFKNLPQAIQNIAGDVSSFKTVEGYLVQQIYSLRLPLLSIILAISLLVGLSAGDEQKGLLETQLALPVSRVSLLLQKVAAAVTIIAFASIGAIVGIAVALSFLGENWSLTAVLKFSLNCLALSILYGLVGLLIAALTGRRALALGIASGFAFLSYLINSMAPSVSYLEATDKLTFFHYYQNDPFQFGNFMILVISAILLLVCSCIAFTKRDIRAN